jgi:hypothetical protein
MREGAVWAFVKWLCGALWIAAIATDFTLKNWLWLALDLLPPVGIVRGAYHLITLFV